MLDLTKEDFNLLCLIFLTYGILGIVLAPWLCDKLENIKKQKNCLPKN